MKLILEVSKHFLSEDRLQVAGVLTGVLFEDTIRRVCRKHNLQEKGRKIDDCVSDLVKAGKLTGIQAQRARAAAAVRTSATHTQWEEFSMNDVEVAYDIAKELISKALDG